MSSIEFSSDQRELMVKKFQQYFESNLDVDLEQFDAEFLLDFIAKDIGAYFYNRGLEDARSIVQERVALIDDDIYAIEKEVD